MTLDDILFCLTDMAESVGRNGTIMKGKEDNG